MTTELLKIGLEQYKKYNEDKLLSEKDETEQAIYFGYIKCIEAVKNMITAIEEMEG